MTNPDVKQLIQKGFDTVAPGYDHDALAFFPETARRMIEHLELQPGQTLLDVCTGTGVVALAAAEKLPAGRVVGIDLSSGMLEQARAKAEGKSLQNLEFLQMDLDELPLAEASFDLATSSFGLFFLEDMVKGLLNITRVVKPGGKIAISSFTGDAFSPMSDLFVNRYQSFGREVPPLSWKRLATKELIEEHFDAAGVTPVSIHHEPLGYQMTSAETWWDVVWNAGWRSLLNQMSEEERAEFKRVHMEEVAEIIGNDGVWFNTEVLIAIGEK